MKDGPNLRILALTIAIMLSAMAGIVCAPDSKGSIGKQVESTFSGDLPAATYQAETAKTAPRPEAYYSAADFGLPAGRVIEYSPMHDYLNNLSTEEGMKVPDIYIHIQPPGDGPIRVQKITYQVWLQLGKDAILK
jgi:hypothetical protein